MGIEGRQAGKGRNTRRKIRIFYKEKNETERRKRERKVKKPIWAKAKE